MTITQLREVVAHTSPTELVEAFCDGEEAVFWIAQSGTDATALRDEGEYVGWWGDFYLRHAALLDGFGGTVRVGVRLDDGGAWEAQRILRLLDGYVPTGRIELRAPAVEMGEGATIADHLDRCSLDETRRVSLADMGRAIRREEARRVLTPPLRFERLAPFPRTASV